MQGKMKAKISRKAAAIKNKESLLWPQFKKGYLKTIEKIFRKTNPGMLEIIHAIDKSPRYITKNKPLYIKKNKKAA